MRLIVLTALEMYSSN